MSCKCISHMLSSSLKNLVNGRYYNRRIKNRVQYKLYIVLCFKFLWYWYSFIVIKYVCFLFYLCTNQLTMKWKIYKQKASNNMRIYCLNLFKSKDAPP